MIMAAVFFQNDLYNFGLFHFPFYFAFISENSSLLVKKQAQILQPVSLNIINFICGKNCFTFS